MIVSFKTILQHILLGMAKNIPWTQRMCERVVEKDPYMLRLVPDHLKMQGMCDKTVRDYLFSLQFVPDWFVTQQQVGIWYDDDCVYYEIEMIRWYDGYKKRKGRKAKIKEELIPVSWHPSRWSDWCISEDEKRDTEALRA